MTLHCTALLYAAPPYTALQPLFPTPLIRPPLKPRKHQGYLVYVLISFGSGSGTRVDGRVQCGEPDSFPSAVWRLPARQGVPLSYNLFLGLPSGLRGTAAGGVDVELEVEGGADACSWLFLHSDAVRINVSSVEIAWGETSEHITEMRTDATKDLLMLRLPSTFLSTVRSSKGSNVTFHVDLGFSVSVDPGFTGIYASQWSAGGVDHEMVTTQMEATRE